MNILHFTSGTVPIHSDTGGGVERHIRSVTSELVSQGHSVTIVDNNYGNGPSELNGVSIERFSTPQISTGVFDGWLDTVSNEVIFASRLGRAESLVREADIVHAHNAYVGTRVHRLANKTDTPFVYTCHNGMWCVDDVNAYERQIVRRIEGRLMTHADAGIAVSRAVADGIEDVTDTYPNVVPNGVDIDKFNPCVDGSSIGDKYGLNDSRVVLFVGRLSEAKGVDTLVKSVRSVVDNTSDPVKFLLVGPNVQMFGSETESEYGAEIHRLVDHEDVGDYLQFAGRISESDLTALYAAADVFALPSRFEAQPMVLVEALASGTPVVGSSAGGIPEVVTENVGSVVPTKNPEKLAKALTTILNLSSEEYEQMRQASRSYVESEYSWSNIVNRLSNIYLDLV